MLHIQVPVTYPEERVYIIRLIFEYFWGIEVVIQGADRRETCISCGNGTILMVADGLFSIPEGDWLKGISLPPTVPVMWDLPVGLVDDTTLPRNFPVLYGKSPEDPDFIKIQNNSISLGLDVFGCCFFMLTRYEEAIAGERDVHGRFPASASVAYQWGVLGRPIVNEYLELLWCLLLRLWPNLIRIKRSYQVCLSHDVDRPYSSDRFIDVIKSAAADTLQRKDLNLSLRRLRSGVLGGGDGREFDPFNNFDYVMNQSEKNGLKSAFFFIPSQGNSGGTFGSYDIESTFMRSLVKKISLDGHEIGFHPNYSTYRDPKKTQYEFDRLRSVVERVGAAQSEWGGRQHYLQWENPTTWQNWEDAGLSYDSTLTFADQVGFRCGICFDYPVFNLHGKTPLRLLERPLVVMECTLLDYMGIDTDTTIQKIIELANACRRHNGKFTVLWHNHYLISKNQRNMYEEILRQIN